jgi:hypothetical protein
MYALSHNADRLKSPLSALKASPGFWFLVAGAADAVIIAGGLKGLAILGVLAVAGTIFWPTLERIVRSW